MLRAWFLAFVLTQALEIPIAVALSRQAEVGFSRRVVLAFFASLATHPVVWFVVPLLGLSGGSAVALSEAWACAIETVFYVTVFPKLSAARCIAISALANGVSFSAGLIIDRFTGLFTV
jgi:hypothetical protein